MIMIGNKIKNKKCIKFNFGIAMHVPDYILCILLLDNYTLYFIGFTLRSTMLYTYSRPASWSSGQSL